MPSLSVCGLHLWFLPVTTRVPYHFGAETLSTVVCARVAVRLRDAAGREAEGWGETPLNVGWVWPSSLPHAVREAALKSFCEHLAAVWSTNPVSANHPLEMGVEFLSRHLPQILADFNATQPADVRLPWLAALVCASAYDLALYDAYGILKDRPVFDTLGPDFLARDLAAWLEPASASVSFAGRYPADYLFPRQVRLPVWHSVGAGDPLEEADLQGDEPRDGLPLLLADWIRRDGIFCLKVKLSGGDAEGDYARLTRIGAIGRAEGVLWLCADYNCTAPDVAYVTTTLDRLLRDDPLTYAMLLYVEQPFHYDLEAHPLDVHAISARKPLFMDESAHDWKLLRLGRTLGWNGAALKTCKTLTEALLALCWARAHGMTLMVQDLTNPMLAMIPHAQLAAHAGTLMGLESNAPQYYPAASAPEAAIHPGLYRRRDGHIDLSTLTGPGFGYRIAEITRELPTPVFQS